MNKAVFRALAILAPFGAASALIPLQDGVTPAWIAAPILLLLARCAAAAFDLAAGPPLRAFRSEEQVYSAPFAIRILSLVSAPGARDLGIAAALWILFAAAAYAAEAAFERPGRSGLPVFAVTLGALAAGAALAGAAAALTGAALVSAFLLYIARRRARG